MSANMMEELSVLDTTKANTPQDLELTFEDNLSEVPQDEIDRLAFNNRREAVKGIRKMLLDVEGELGLNKGELTALELPDGLSEAKTVFKTTTNLKEDVVVDFFHRLDDMCDTYVGEVHDLFRLDDLAEPLEDLRCALSTLIFQLFGV